MMLEFHHFNDAAAFIRSLLAQDAHTIMLGWSHTKRMWVVQVDAYTVDA